MSTGLSASPWFYEMRKRWGTAGSPVVSVKEAGGMATLKNTIAPRALVVGYETDLDPNTPSKPQGLLCLLTDNSPGTPASMLSDILLYRGRYRSDEAPDFFTGNITEDYGHAYDKAGYTAMMEKRYPEAISLFTSALMIDPMFPRSASNLGYLYFITGDYERAYNAYLSAGHGMQDMLTGAAAFNALPVITDGIKSDLATTYNNLGAVEERLGRREAARDYYFNSYSLFPNGAAHYNMAVLNWGTDWPQAIEHLQRAVELDPSNVEYRQRLGGAIQLSGRGAPAHK
jgi:tetratricopeptide (TPR) repeat protein